MAGWSQSSAAESCQQKAAAAPSSPELQARLYRLRSSDPDLAGKPAQCKDHQHPAWALIYRHRANVLSGSLSEPVSPPWVLIRAAGSETSKGCIAGEKSSFLQNHKWCPLQQAFRKLLGLNGSGGLLGQAESMETPHKARGSFFGLNQHGQWQSCLVMLLGHCQPSEIWQQWFLHLAVSLSAWLSPPHKTRLLDRETQQQRDRFLVLPLTRSRPGTRCREEADVLQQVSNYKQNELELTPCINKAPMQNN